MLSQKEERKEKKNKERKDKEKFNSLFDIVNFKGKYFIIENILLRPTESTIFF